MAKIKMYQRNDGSRYIVIPGYKPEYADGFDEVEFSTVKEMCRNTADEFTVKLLNSYADDKKVYIANDFRNGKNVGLLVYILNKGMATVKF